RGHAAGHVQQLLDLARVEHDDRHQKNEPTSPSSASESDSDRASCTFSRWSGRRGPTTTDPTRPSAHASASAAVLTPRAVAASASRSSPACTGSLSRCRYGSGRIVIREPGGGSWPRRYFPVSHPPASGLNAWYSIPCSSHSGSTSWSSPRSSSEYE